jgi:thiazolylpeptide-type bacteriocin precursor
MHRGRPPRCIGLPKKNIPQRSKHSAPANQELNAPERLTTMIDTKAVENFASFNIVDLDVLEIADGTALPQMGASFFETFCCSSSTCTV